MTTQNSSSQMEKLVELVGGEKVAVTGGDSGDEYGVEIEDAPLQESFTAKLLFFPRRNIPTEKSGLIVYGTTAIICKDLAAEAGVAAASCSNRLMKPFSSCFPSCSAAVFITILCVVLANYLPQLLEGHAGVMVPCILLAVLCVVCVVIIWRQPESKEALTFKVTVLTSHLRKCSVPVSSGSQF